MGIPLALRRKATAYSVPRNKHLPCMPVALGGQAIRRARPLIWQCALHHVAFLTIQFRRPPHEWGAAVESRAAHRQKPPFIGGGGRG
jgi:hypothetical protein